MQIKKNPETYIYNTHSKILCVYQTCQLKVHSEKTPPPFLPDFFMGSFYGTLFESLSATARCLNILANINALAFAHEQNDAFPSSPCSADRQTQPGGAWWEINGGHYRVGLARRRTDEHQPDVTPTFRRKSSRLTRGRTLWNRRAMKWSNLWIDTRVASRKPRDVGICKPHTFDLKRSLQLRVSFRSDVWWESLLSTEFMDYDIEETGKVSYVLRGWHNIIWFVENFIFQFLFKIEYSYVEWKKISIEYIEYD